MPRHQNASPPGRRIAGADVRPAPQGPSHHQHRRAHRPRQRQRYKSMQRIFQPRSPCEPLCAPGSRSFSMLSLKMRYIKSASLLPLGAGSHATVMAVTPKVPGTRRKFVGGSGAVVGSSTHRVCARLPAASKASCTRRIRAVFGIECFRVEVESLASRPLGITRIPLCPTLV
jgi:hypothetical protein